MHKTPEYENGIMIFYHKKECNAGVSLYENKCSYKTREGSTLPKTLHHTRNLFHKFLRGHLTVPKEKRVRKSGTLFSNSKSLDYFLQLFLQAFLAGAAFCEQQSPWY